MRPLVFLFPHDRLDVGGNSAQMRFVEACSSFTDSCIAYYGPRIAGHLHIDDYLKLRSPYTRAHAPIFVIHWGPDVSMLLETLKAHDVVYVAHSTGWLLTLPENVPILCVSRHTMAYWGRHAPNAFIGYVPNVVGMPSLTCDARDIDVLVQGRKSSRYLLDRLVPALRDKCRVELLDGWVDDLSIWFQRAKVYLYDSLEHWVDLGATEGFGLPPLEALAHGCVVFSSVNDALADYLDPGLNCRKIRVHSLAWDVEAVLRAVQEQQPAAPTHEWFGIYARQAATARLQRHFTEIVRFFDLTAYTEPDIENLWQSRRPTSVQRARRAVRVLSGR